MECEHNRGEHATWMTAGAHLDSDQPGNEQRALGLDHGTTDP